MNITSWNKPANSVLAIKINIVLQININGSSSAGRKEGFGDPHILSEFYQ